MQKYWDPRNDKILSRVAWSYERHILHKIQNLPTTSRFKFNANNLEYFRCHCIADECLSSFPFMPLCKVYESTNDPLLPYVNAPDGLPHMWWGLTLYKDKFGSKISFRAHFLYEKYKEVYIYFCLWYLHFSLHFALLPPILINSNRHLLNYANWIKR